MSNERQHPMWAKCGDSGCKQAWPATYLPADMGMVAAILAKAACPMCGNRKPVIAKQEGGRLLDPDCNSTADLLLRQHLEQSLGLMDDGMRTTPGFAAEQLKGKGLVGLTSNLRRLQDWLDRMTLQESSRDGS